MNIYQTYALLVIGIIILGLIVNVVVTIVDRRKLINTYIHFGVIRSLLRTSYVQIPASIINSNSNVTNIITSSMIKHGQI